MKEAMKLEDLYTPEILALATAIPDTAPLAEAHGEAVRHTRTCGSRITTQVMVDEKGRLVRLAQQVQACALGQASAAIVGRAAIGATQGELEEGRALLHAMLKEGVRPPAAGRWKELAALAPVRRFPPRHEAVLLPFDAAITAMNAACAGGAGK